MLKPVCYMLCLQNTRCPSLFAVYARLLNAQIFETRQHPTGNAPVPIYKNIETFRLVGPYSLLLKRLWAPVSKKSTPRIKF